MSYQPPCTITAAIERLLGEICETVGRLTALSPGADLRLRRINRIRTIHGSLAIEGNTLSEEQITAILAGKQVVAPPREIQEVRNAIEVYDRLEQWNPYREKDFLTAHEIMMRGLIDFPGRYRSGGVGVMGRKEVMHVAPPASMVPGLMARLFGWLGRKERHPLVASSIFHYELEFIHPLEDGNGRMGRFWQTLILFSWTPVFVNLPVESMVHMRQKEYYRAIEKSSSLGDSAPFVEFMLRAIYGAVCEAAGQTRGDQVFDQVNDQVARLVQAMDERFVSSSEIMARLGLSHRPTFRKNYLGPGLEKGFVTMKYPESPRHPGQRYKLTPKGLEMKLWLEKAGHEHG